MYRRWASRRDLAVAALRHHHDGQSFPVPDTGGLRTDLIEILKEVTNRRMDQVALFSLHMGEFFAETGSSLEDLRNEILGDGPTGLDTILERAVARGEIEPHKLTPRVRNAPFDLLCHQVLMTLKPVPDKDILSIVDEIFLPLVRPDRTS